MGIWDFIDSGKETVKRYTPDLVTPVTKVCKASYYYSTTAVKKMDNYMSDDEGRAKMVNFSTKFVKNASIYAAKEAANIFIPGGRAVSKIYSETIREMEIESKKNQDTSCIKDIIGNSRKDTTNAGPPGLVDGPEMLESKELKLGSQNRVQVDSFTQQTPEDVLRVFMMKEFMGTHFLDSLLVPNHGQRKKVN
ncbi:uncharacterized protein LOC132029458 isoform X2 [Lycium ferocissimum]|uniref:uncharacterized protein LOC132029458 isoform X2 n=1 Tax=Lycium ferocissimum TaxID=112874 RepID=UPI0028158EF7|nr:uncharacterized protein LOC132029458 isoform X2 [Lycium ferocissimum]